MKFKLAQVRLLSFFLLSFGSHLITKAQVSVEKDPFLHWKSVSKGLDYSSVVVEPTGGNGHFLSNQISHNQGVIVGVTHPKGFKEVDGKVFFGLGVKVVNPDTGEELLQQDDIYTDQEGVNPELLQRLTVKFKPEDKTHRAKRYHLTATVFDKNSEARIVIELPLTVAEQADVSLSSHFHSSWSITPSYKLVSQNIDLKGSEILVNGLKSMDLSWKATDQIEFRIDTGKFAQKNFHSYVSLTDKEGVSRYEHRKQHPSNWNGSLNISYPTDSLAIAPYLLTVAVKSESGEVGFSEWFYYKGQEKFLSTEQKKEFAKLHLSLAQRLNQSNKNQDALQELENALFYQPTLTEAHLEKGIAYQKLTKYESAIQTFEKVRELDSTSTKALNELGWLYKKQKEYGLALERYTRSVEIDSSQYMGNYQVGWLHNELKHYEMALPYLSRAVRLNPKGYYQPFTERILANRKLKNHKAVIADYKSLTQLYPKHSDYYYQIGYYQIELEEYEKAIEAFDQSIALDTYDYKPLYEKAYAQKMQHAYAESLKNFEKALKLGGSKVPNAIYLNLGDLYYLLSQYKKACKHYETALEKNVKYANERLKEYCGG